jgi:hypothetical protein
MFNCAALCVWLLSLCKGQILEKSLEEAYKLYVRAAELGNDAARRNLALHYFNLADPTPALTKVHELWCLYLSCWFGFTLEPRLEELATEFAEGKFTSDEDTLLHEAIVSILPQPIYEELFNFLLPLCPSAIPVPEFVVRAHNKTTGNFR